MHIILFSRKQSQAENYRLSVGASFTIIGVIVAIAIGLGATLHRGYDLWNSKNYYRGESTFIRSDIERNAQNIELAKQQAEEKLLALTARMAELQARVTRLDALGERLVAIESLDPEEFDFATPPAVGGPDVAVSLDNESRPDFMRTLDLLSSEIVHREEQLALLEKLLTTRNLSEQKMLTGKPVVTGWMTSRFGRRIDPFNGHVTMHEGLDFAGHIGADILSVGDGVVTWAGEKLGYGQLVEINHGQGYTTRYGHASEVLVKVGDVVKKGQLIAKMGSTGRSTGPHVHFEVRKDGLALDPARVMYRHG